MPPGRLTSSRAITAVFAAGCSAAVRTMAVHLLLRGDDDPPRLAIVAGRRVGGAVERNRAKRRLRAAAREVSWPAGADAVVTARAHAVCAPFGELVQGLETCLASALGQAAA